MTLCESGAARAGLGIGLESTALPVLTMSIALISAYWLGNTSGGGATPAAKRSLMPPKL